jgi:hypothetical protein
MVARVIPCQWVGSSLTRPVTSGIIPQSDVWWIDWGGELAQGRAGGPVAVGQLISNTA